MNWNDLRYILAISRGGTLAQAARLLAVDDSTVARRLIAMQDAIGTRLYHRSADGTLQLTPAGERAARHAERIEREIGVLDAELSGGDQVASGVVRLTSVPIIVNHLLIPAAPGLLKRHPQLELQLIGDPRDLNLTRREADLALRLARPKKGGTRVRARRVGSLRYAVYVAASCPAREARMMPWITYDEAMGHLPQAGWIAATIKQKGECAASVRVNDAEAVLEGVAAGLGRSLLPRVVADRDARLRYVAMARGPPPPERELWLLAHADLSGLGRINAVVRWIEQTAPR